MTFVRKKKRFRNRSRFFFLYFLFPCLILFQIRFLTRNIRSFDKIGDDKLASEINFRRLNESKRTSNDVHELLERLKREREEIESRKEEASSKQNDLEELLEPENTEEVSVSKQNDLEELLEPENTAEVSVQVEEKITVESIVDPHEVVDEGSMEFADVLNKLRDEFLAVAVAQAEEELLNRSKMETTIVSTSPTQSTIRKPPPNQPMKFLDPVLSPPKINNVNTSTIILVPSHQGSFVKRQAIRQTWMTRAKHSATIMVLFVVAQSDCNEFDMDLDVNASTSNSTMQSTSNSTNLTSPACDQIDHNFLKLEQEQNQDLLEIPMKENYQSLPEKMMQAYNWVMEKVPNLKWVAKADDDMFVNVRNLELYLRKYNPEIPIVIGEIIYHSRVAKEGKWAEYDYNNAYYPYWPKGSAGHVLSRGTLNYFIGNFESLHRYQGEDVSIGIWLDDAHKSGRLNDTTWIHAPQNFVSESDGFRCEGSSNLIMVGHNFAPSDQMLCHEAAINNESFDNAWHDVPSNFQQLIQMGYENS